MKRFALFFAFLVFVGLPMLQAQTVQITGKITSSEDGNPIPGVSVVVKGTTIGTTTDFDGKYSLNVPSNSASLVFSFVGLKSQEVAIGGRSSVDIVMETDVVGLEEVVVTALGISRDKKSLGYATQEVKGDQVSTVKSDNFINSLSGKVSGVNITKTTNFGGSTNIIIRGSTSLTGNNQALFVVDGVPVNNTTTNTSYQSQAGGGYDFGNAASDINPADIESINVLKGSAATALYGSRAANGVIMITTKKGSLKKTGVGVMVNSNVTIGSVDKSTFAEYQNEYGGAYGPYYAGPGGFWRMVDFNGDKVNEQWVTTSEDASFGAHFDPNLMVYQWNAVDPQSPNYFKATPWVMAENGPITFFENPTTFTNSVAIENGFDNGSYRLSYTNYKQNGLLPNSELKRNNLLMNGTWKVTKRLTASGSANFVRTDGLGRNSTGYNDNIAGSFRQWFQTNVDIQEQKDAYFSTKRNVTWNWKNPKNAIPAFWDNPYWTRYENYETDNRNRFFGYLSLNYKLADWLEIFGRASTDFYNGLEEERRAIGSVPNRFGIGTGSAADGSLGQSEQPSGYLRRDITSSEDNFDFMLNINKDLSDDLNLKAVIGGSSRRTNYSRIISATNGGLNVEKLYSLQNSINALPYPKELASKIGVNGVYSSVSLGFRNYLFLDGALRRDHSSTLPEGNSVYYYPSISSSFIFSNFINQSWISFGKIRLNYAEVGSSAGFDQVNDSYRILTPFGNGVSAVSTTKKNSDLVPERTKSVEGGLEMYFLDKRIGFDLALYKTNTVNQILPLSVSKSTGYNFTYINAGEMENKGIELALSGTPVKTTNFNWNINVNWSKNVNKVVSLYTSGKDTIKNLQLGSFQGGVTINAKVGEPYGIINGTDYTYKDGQRLIYPYEEDEDGEPLASNGQYIVSNESDRNIGNITPDWRAGISNTFTYKNLSLSFLIDIQKGGSIFSLDMWYGMGTGLYKETVYTNDLGNPVRNPLVGDPTNGYAANSGGYVLQGVNPDGSPNKTRHIADQDGSYGYDGGYPNSTYVYDASYVKLREVSLAYSLPTSLLQKSFIKGVSLGIVGSNLWIIHKNLPYADPESGLGAGNLQGYSTGSLPSTRDFGFDVKLSF